jgi:NAD(P)H dehydrogenase (quinone)
MVFNMIIVGGPTWDQPFGASAITGEEPFNSQTGKPVIDPKFLKKGTALGERVANITSRVKE